MKQLFISIGLYLLSVLLRTLLFFPIIFYQLYKYFKKKEDTQYLSKLLFALAQAVDEFGNVFGQELWNDVLITPTGYQFGLAGERMSSVIGKNCETNTLSKTGIWLNNQLNKVQKNHSILSIQQVVD